jgi:hypothetical protein
MRIRSLVGALVLSAAVPLALPAEAQASHRHSRYCGHRYTYQSYQPYRSSYGYGYDRGYSSYGYDPGYSSYGYGGYRSYDYGYRPYYSPRYSYAPAPGYYYRAPRYRRPRVSIHLSF